MRAYPDGRAGCIGGFGEGLDNWEKSVAVRACREEEGIRRRLSIPNVHIMLGTDDDAGASA